MNTPLFNQPAPELGNQYDDDRVLQSYLQRHMPAPMLAEQLPALRELGQLAGGELYQMQLADRLNEPVLTQWDAWGNRIDQIEVTPLWKRAEKVAAEFGVVAAAYEKKYGRYARLHQFALAYLFHPSTDVYTCPLAMTDGAARTLLLSGNEELIARAVPHLTSRDPNFFWTSGQWMTESTGGSDVGLSQTTAVLDEQEQWRLHGRKWFTSAATGQMTLTLARPQGGTAGGKGLALFYLETRNADGRLQQMEILRLKDKLGTRKVPTAEILLHGSVAVPVNGLQHGVRQIVPMLHLTRTWNAVTAVAFMRRGVALARDYARKRVAFGTSLAEKPLHVDTLAAMQAEFEAGFQLAFYGVSLIGKDEAGEASDDERALLRLLTSINKLTTAKQAVAIASEVLEAHGGAGYVEDTGLPLLLRDSQVLPIWEGTTNVLALDTMRALADGRPLQLLGQRLMAAAQAGRDERLVGAGQTAVAAFAHAQRWLQQASQQGQTAVEAGARRFALTVGRALALALLVEQAQWSLDIQADGRGRAAACRFAQSAIDLIVDAVDVDGHALANDTPLAL